MFEAFEAEFITILTLFIRICTDCVEIEPYLMLLNSYQHISLNKRDLEIYILFFESKMARYATIKNIFDSFMQPTKKYFAFASK